MNRMPRRPFVRLAATGLAGALLGACASPTATGAPRGASAPSGTTRAAWETEWDRVVEAAEREGVLSVAMAPGDAYRQASAAFAQAFPRIRVEVSGASGREFAPRILSERQA